MILIKNDNLERGIKMKLLTIERIIHIIKSYGAIADYYDMTHGVIYHTNTLSEADEKGIRTMEVTDSATNERYIIELAGITDEDLK